MSSFGYLGLFLIGIAGIYAVREYTVYLSLAEEEYREMLEFLYHIKRELRSFMKTPADIASGFKDGYLRANGALDAFARSRGDIMLSKSLIGKADKDMLSAYFIHFGTGLYEVELEAIGQITERFGARAREVIGNSEKSRKLTPVIYVFAFVSLVLLLL